MTKTRKLVEAAKEINEGRDTINAVVTFDSRMAPHLKITGGVPLEVDNLIRDGCLISPRSARKECIVLY